MGQHIEPMANIRDNKYSKKEQPEEVESKLEDSSSKQKITTLDEKIEMPNQGHCKKKVSVILRILFFLLSLDSV